MSELITFGPKMYQLIIKWVKTMKGISLRGNIDMLSNDKIPLYKNPVLDFCCVLQYGSELNYNSMQDIWDAM